MKKFLFLLLAAVLVACTTTPPAPASNTRSTDPQQLIGTRWQWIKTVTPGEVIEAVQPERYSFLLHKDGAFEARFDCNTVRGGYEISPGQLKFGLVQTTLMGCMPDSQDWIFSRNLLGANSFFIEEGMLYLELPDDGGTMHFKPESNTRSTDPQQLIGTRWQWIKTVTPVEVIEAVQPERYYFLLNKDGTLEALFDCNHAHGSYEISPGQLKFGPVRTTRMECMPGSQDWTFSSNLLEANSFFIEKGMLYLELPDDGGTMHFKPE